MSTFTLYLNSATRRERIDGVSGFVAADASGQFGVLANHARMITVLTYGLARYRVGDADWLHLALPGGILMFRDNTLSVTARRYVQGPDYERISLALDAELQAEEQRLGALRQHLEQLEREMFRKLWHLERR